MAAKEAALVAAREKAFLEAEENRRKHMFLSGNYQPLGFALGEELEDDIFGVCKVIGLPAADAATPAPGRTGARGTVWVLVEDSQERVWRTAGHLKKKEKGVASPLRTSPRLVQKNVRAQRERAAEAAGGSSRKRILVESSEGDDSDVESYNTEGGKAATDVPALAKHERNRKAKLKPDKKMKKGVFNTAVGTITKQTSVPLTQRLSEFSDNGLSISAGALWCGPCKKVVPNLKQTIELHVSSAKHKTNLSKHVRQDKRAAQLANDLVAYFEANPNDSGVCCARPLIHVN